MVKAKVLNAQEEIQVISTECSSTNTGTNNKYSVCTQSTLETYVLADGRMEDLHVVIFADGRQKVIGSFEQLGGGARGRHG